MHRYGSDRERHRRLRAAFETVLDADPSDRTAVIDELAAGDDEFRRELQALFAAHESTDRLSDRPAAKAVRDLLETGEADATDPPSDRTIGAYRLVERIAVGGMGAVYRAERTFGGFEQTVAIKILPLGRESEELLERFESERRILAALDHPKIARLFDGGTTEDGLPYIVMEYVQGRPIDRYCNEERLSLDDRLALFLGVCEAVQAAHRALIVHRDLKPSNILVTDRGTPKLLDFGIAKLVDPEWADAAGVRTGTAVRPMTPAYASPEQVRGEPVTTATDVYSLGMILYRLLTGNRPYGPTPTPAELEQAILDTAPDRPSAAVSEEAARQTAMTLDRLRRRLRGDLDNIVLKALRKEPERRYASVAELTADIERHRTGHPVAARADTMTYRARKFVRRNATSVAAAVVTLLALVGGLGIALWQGHEARAAATLAERRFETARNAARALMFEVHDEVADLPGSTPVRELIVSRAVDYLDRLAPEARDDPELRLDLAQAFLRVGNVQGNPTARNLGRLQDALESYRRGLDMLPEDSPGDSLGLATTHLRAVLLEKSGDVLAHLGQPDSALAAFDQALILFRKNVEIDPDPDRLVALAIEHLKRGDYTGNPNFPNAGRPAEAMSYYRTTLDLLERVHRQDTTSTRTARLLGIAHERLGSIHSEQGDYGRALESFRRSDVIRSRLHSAFPDDPHIHRDAAIAREKLGLTYQMEGRLEEARTELEAAHAEYERLAESSPRDMNAQVTLAVNGMQRGALMASPDLPSFGDTAAARRHYTRALARLRRVAAVDSTNERVAALIDDIEAALNGF